jgi:hypothetical protein
VNGRFSEEISFAIASYVVKPRQILNRLSKNEAVSFVIAASWCTVHVICTVCATKRRYVRTIPFEISYCVPLTQVLIMFSDLWQL